MTPPHSPRDGIFGVVNFVVSKTFYCNVKIPLRFIKKHNKTPYHDKKNHQITQTNKPHNKTKKSQKTKQNKFKQPWWMRVSPLIFQKRKRNYI